MNTHHQGRRKPVDSFFFFLTGGGLQKNSERTGENGENSSKIRLAKLNLCESLPVGLVAAEDHLRFANQQVGAAEGVLVILWSWKVSSIQLLQTQEEVAESSQEELAAVHQVVVT